MGFMMNAWESFIWIGEFNIDTRRLCLLGSQEGMVMLTFGRYSLIFLTIRHRQPWLNRKFFVCMAGCPHPLKPLTIYGILTVSKRFLTRALCVISYGLTRMIAVVGVSHPEVLVIPSVRTYLSSLTIQIV